MNSPGTPSPDPGMTPRGQGRTVAPFTRRCANCQMALPVGARFCLNCGQPVGAGTHADQAQLFFRTTAVPRPLVEKVRAAAYLTGERRLVTAVFVDVVGSTALSRQVGVDGWTTIVDRMCDAFCAVVYRYEGTIARFVGDELLAFFGAPVAHEDDPVRAVQAALEILDTAVPLAADIRREFSTEFAIRISLSTGPVTLGPVSSDLRFEYSALEGTLNLAAQLEATKRSMAVLASEDTYRLVAPFFDCVDLGATAVDSGATAVDSGATAVDPGATAVGDQGEAVRIYQVNGARTRSDRARSLAGLESPMVGRDLALRTLLQLTDAVTVGLGRAVLLAGEAGLGKSRLIAEWQTAVAQTGARDTLQWAAGHCLSYGQGMAYHLLRDLLRSLIGVTTAAAEPETRAALRDLTTRLFGDATLDVYPYLGHLLALTLDDEALQRIQPLDPPALQAQYLAAFKRLLLALASGGPLVLVLEDLQWADPSSAAILSQLLPLAATSPLLFCLAARPRRETPGWKLVTTCRDTLGGRFTELWLELLSEADSRQILANLLQNKPFPQKVQELILKKAEGNPFFIEEVLRMMIDQGAIQRRNGSWIITAETGTPGIPDNLQGLLLARLDRLPDDARHTLRVAAVLGRRFAVRVLEQIVGQGREAMALINHLGELESSGLIDVYQVKPDLTYRFHNTLLQEAIYASLLPADRRRLHLAVGEALEHLYAATLETVAPQLARHFLVAGDRARALTYVALAGDVALNSGASQEAESRFRQALDLAPASAEQAALTYKLGLALYRQSRFQDAVDVWSEGIKQFQALGDADGVALLYARSARAIWSAGDTPGSLRLCREGLTAVAGAPESPGLALLLHEAARAHLFNGLSDEGRRLCRQALALAERLEDVVVQAEALATLGLLHNQSPEEALAALSKAADLAESAGLLSQAARAHVNLAALMATALPDFAAACDHYRRAAELQRLQGNTAGELLGLGGMAGVLLDMGNLEEVDATLPVMRRLLDELGDRGPAAFHIRVSEALLRRYRGELPEAGRLLRALQAEERSRGNLRNLIDVDVHLAEVMLASRTLPGQTPQGDWSDLEAVLAEAIEICERWSVSATWPRCLLCMTYTARGRLDEARRLLSEIQALADSRPAVPDLGWPEWAEARLAVAEARWPAAQSLLETAAGLFARIGKRWYEACLLLEWADALTSRGEPTDLEQARALLQKAASRFAVLGSPLYADLADGRLRQLEVKSYARALAHQKVDQELAAAGKIQTGFLPATPPALPGWQLTAALEPSRRTSGDFYDFIPLPDGRLAIVIADVADKGAAAALFMALSSSLIRTYAADYAAQPERVLSETNRRILADTHTGLFVTVFYAVLDPATGALHYANAGHNPPYHFRHDGAPARPLTGTGIPVGILEEAAWTTGTIQLAPGDLLVLYTDGVTDAQDQHEAFFSAGRLLETVERNRERSARAIQDAILTAIHDFVGGVPQFDDIALLILGRDLA